MSRKDYELLAGCLRRARHNALPAERASIRRVEDVLCGALERDNPRFDAKRFRSAAARSAE